MSKTPLRKLGANGPTVSSIGFGAMGIGAWYGSTDEDEAFKALTYAANRGVTFWDTADIYGTSEKFIGEWFAKTGRRSEIFLATKFGAFDPDKDFTGPDANSSPSYIRKALARSLKELNTPYIDLYYQHGVDPKVPIEIVLDTLREPVEKGTIRWIGLSNCTINVLRRAKAVPGIGEKVVACQMEYSPFELELEKNGFLNTARDLGVSIVAYSPLGRGLATGRYRSRADLATDDLRLMMPRFSEENFSKNLELVDKLQSLAKKYNATASQIVLAWMLAEHGDLIPIPGCRSVARVEENASAAELQLSVEDKNSIRALCENADVRGGRLPEVYAGLVKDCIPLSEWKGE